MEWEKIKEQLIEAQGQKKNLKQDLIATNNKLEETSKLLLNLEECRRIIQQAAQQTQNMLKDDLENIVTAALKSVPFEQEYSFIVDFVMRRNTTECDLLFERDGHRVSPLESCSYGAADIASFALRVAYWKLHGGLSPFIACDEPFHNLDKNKHIYAVEIVKRLNKEFGIQFLISSHEPTIIKSADKIFRVVMTNGESKVIEETQ